MIILDEAAKAGLPHQNVNVKGTSMAQHKTIAFVKLG